MKTVIILLFGILSLFANEFYAKLEPIQSYIVKASVSGQVIYSNDALEGKLAKNSVVVEIDSMVNNVELKQLNEKINIINSMMQIEEKNYNRLKNVSTRSAFEKDAQRIKFLNLKSTRSDLLTKKAMLEDTIKDKQLIESNRYIYNINVKKGDYVNPGTLLYEAKDLTQGKLEIYLPINDVDNYKNKTIYLDGKKTALKLEKIYEVADDKHISSYKAQIIMNNPKKFSRLVKIEFK